MAKRKNIESKETIESLISRLEQIEKDLSEGNLKISEQVDLYNEAVILYKRIKKDLSEINTKINLIDPRKEEENRGE